MKITTRLLLTFPFALFTFLYLRLQLSGNGCWGRIELIYTVMLWFFLAITFILSAVAIIRKRQSERLKAEPFTLTITVFTLLMLIVGGVWDDSLKGAKWIEARNQNYNASPSAQSLTLRKNGDFTVHLREDDFTCYYSGTYKKSGDTIFFDNGVVDKTNSKMTTQYLLKDNILFPLKSDLNGTEQFQYFDITLKK